MFKLLNPEARKMATIINQNPNGDLVQAIEQASDQPEPHMMYVDQRTLLSLLCWWREKHVWTMENYEYHHDGSETHHYRCCVCKAHGVSGK